MLDTEVISHASLMNGAPKSSLEQSEMRKQTGQDQVMEKEEVLIPGFPLFQNWVCDKTQHWNVYFCIPTDSVSLGSLGTMGTVALPWCFVLSSIKECMKKVSQKLQQGEKGPRKSSTILSKAQSIETVFSNSCQKAINLSWKLGTQVHNIATKATLAKFLM